MTLLPREIDVVRVIGLFQLKFNVAKKQTGFFIPDNAFSTGFFRAVERKIDVDMADFTLRWK